MTGYTSSIPQAGNDPADDQPLMLNNFGAINQWVNVDHVGFNTTGFGEHNVVTFNDNNVPALPTPIVSGNNVGILFTNTVPAAGAINQLFYFAGDAAHSSNQYVAAATGSTLALGGIIVKWGHPTLPGTGFDQAVAFGVPFPTNCFAVIVTTTDRSITAGVVNNSITVNGFTATKSSSGSALPIYYVAIGN